MKKILLFGMFFQLMAMTVMAQTSTLVGQLVDADDQSGLIGAHIVLKSDAYLGSGISDQDGSFRIEGLKEGGYEMQISYIGYETIYKDVVIKGEVVNLGVVKLKEGLHLDELRVVKEQLSVVQNGDTTQFNASSYKTLPDASAEDLIEKMPTIVIEDGQVQAQGEDVKKVLVDGKPFFGNDPTAALRNLPAEVIEKIQVYDELSDQAKFTGFDDGETTKTINIVTKSNRNTGQFGKVYGGYGYEDKYVAGGNINIFNGDQRLSIIGLTNNINQQNFASDDILGVIGTSGSRGGRRGGGGGPGGGGPGGGPGGSSSTSDFLVPQQGGISSTNALGFNFTDEWNDKWKVSASYFFNETDNLTEQLLTQQYFDAEGLTSMYDEESFANSTNQNHRFSTVIDYQMNDRNSLILRSNLSWQGNDGIENVFGQTMWPDLSESQYTSEFTADLSALSISNNLLWRHNFEKMGRTFSVNLTQGLAPSIGDSYLTSNNIFEGVEDLLQQHTTLDNQQWNMGVNAQYTEPLGDKGRMMFDYRFAYQQEESNQSTYDYEESSQEYDLYNDELSNIFSSDYVSQTLGTGYQLRQGDWHMMVRGGVQWSNMLAEQQLPYESVNDVVYWNVLPMANLFYRPSRTETFRLSYRARTDLPSITELQDVIDNSNPLQLTTGNPLLDQGYQHSLSAHYNKTITEKSAVFFARLAATIDNQYIGNSTYSSASDYDADLASSAQITVPVNLSGYYTLRSILTYGFPITQIKSNLNIDLSSSYTHSPSLINEVLNYSKNTSMGLGLTLSSNVSERMDFTLSSRTSYNFAKNTLQSVSNTNYYNQSTKLKWDWIITDGWVFRNELNHSMYRGLGEGYDQNYLLWNFSLGKKVFKDDRGEIGLTVFDLLNQNSAISRNVTDYYTEDLQTNVLGQYLMVNFKYDIRNFKI
ncbi:outer membrane beta-barrel protein [Membranihabitans marinus]|uniref:outer membrane beta-barrel protein n=1 Tax=Membranihabitans marinus TaxID=1227546 RepID=UPI001F2006C7|nr:outer membrane beta-barrel protein [Membranihabitans marinus]